MIIEHIHHLTTASLYPSCLFEARSSFSNFHNSDPVRPLINMLSKSNSLVVIVNTFLKGLLLDYFQLWRYLCQCAVFLQPCRTSFIHQRAALVYLEIQNKNITKTPMKSIMTSMQLTMMLLLQGCFASSFASKYLSLHVCACVCVRCKGINYLLQHKHKNMVFFFRLESLWFR